MKRANCRGMNRNPFDTSWTNRVLWFLAAAHRSKQIADRRPDADGRRRAKGAFGQSYMNRKLRGVAA